MVEKTKYTKQELQEFEKIINDKLEKARTYVKKLKINMAEENQNIGTLNTSDINDNAEIGQRDNLNQLIVHQEKFITHLERAQERIKQGTYGICVVTGKLISKERLRAVPHTTHSVEAKQKRIPRTT